MKSFYVDEVGLPNCFARKLPVIPYFLTMHPVLETGSRAYESQ